MIGNGGIDMKKLTRLLASALAVTMVLTAASCAKTPEETEAETSASETTTEEETTTTETTEETTTETSEETEESETSAAVTAPEGETFDLEEYPIDLTVDSYVAALDAVGSDVSYEVDDFLDITDSIKLGDEDAIDQYQDGIAVVCSGDAVFELLDKFADPVSSDNADFNDHLTDVCIFTAADPYTSDYQIIVMYYAFDDQEYLQEWYGSAVAKMIESSDELFPESDNYDTGMSVYENGDAKAFLAKCALSDKGLEEYGKPENSGAYIAFYVNGNSGMYISITDFTEDNKALGMLDDFCDEMGLMSPRDI